MEILKDWILENKAWLFSGVSIAVPLALIRWFFGRKKPETKDAKRSASPLEDWQSWSIYFQILLHRIFASVTLLFVFFCILKVESIFAPIMMLLIAMFILEAYWYRRYLGLRAEGSQLFKENFANSKYTEAIMSLFYSKYSKFPPKPLFIEFLVLTTLCLLTGGIHSPFIFLFAFFGALALYVLNSRLWWSLTYILCICCAFSTIIFGHEALKNLLQRLDLNLMVTAFSTDIKPVPHAAMTVIVFVYSVIMSGTVFYGIVFTLKKLSEDRFGIPRWQTQEFLDVKRILSTSKLGGRLFIIGKKQKYFKENTLALMPYCARNLKCKFRVKKRKGLTGDSQTPFDESCNECGLPCQIGDFCRDGFARKVSIIGTSHNVKNAIEHFAEDSKSNFKYLIASCCTTHLVKYLPEFHQNYPDVTVVFTPLLAGYERCMSSINALNDGEEANEQPKTSFDYSALRYFLKDQLILNK